MNQMTGGGLEQATSPGIAGSEPRYTLSEEEDSGCTEAQRLAEEVLKNTF